VQGNAAADVAQVLQNAKTCNFVGFLLELFPKHILQLCAGEGDQVCTFHFW
jgi:hypothetical protein